MAIKNIETRIQNKHDLEVNWNKASFIPMQGELIIYDVEIDNSNAVITKIVDGVEKTVCELVGREAPYTYERFKIGDGIHTIKDLPFTTDFIQGELETLQSQVADLMYVPIAISSFVPSVGMQERGSVVSNVILSWKLNKVPTEIKLDNETLSNSTTEKAISDLNITWDNTKTWTLSVKDERTEKPVTKTTTITFCNGIYYGVGNVEKSFTSSFVTGLNKQLQTTKAYDFTVSPSSQYIYYAVPKRLGAVTFKVGGFQGGFEAPEVVSVKNSFNYTEDYYVYRSTNKITGSTTVDVT